MHTVEERRIKTYCNNIFDLQIWQRHNITVLAGQLSQFCSFEMHFS